MRPDVGFRKDVGEKEPARDTDGAGRGRIQDNSARAPGSSGFSLTAREKR
jgi:hypothetical protein